MDVLDSKFPRDSRRTNGEIRLKARAMSRGVAIGRVVCLHGNTRQFFRIDIDESAIEQETRRAQAAFRLARRQLNKLRTEPALGVSSVPGIFEAQRAMIEDSSLLSKVEAAVVEEKVNAEWAVKLVTDVYISKYKAITDEHLRERYIDVEDVAERILNALAGGERSTPLAKDSIIVAKELMPSTLAEQSASNPTAVITEHGGWTSHTFILARELNLPAVTGVRKILRRVDTGDAAIVDGYNGQVILNPTAETLERYRLPAAQFRQINYNDVTVADTDTKTLDGREIVMRVNVDLPEIYKRAKRVGARGIGLYRSEFLFNRFKGYPTENQQFDAYREIAEYAAEDGVKIRTFDLGPEQVFGQSHGREKNPALGLRAIRLGLAESRQLRIQLRAILRASSGKNIDVVVPMVSGIDEISQVRELVAKESESLKSKGAAIGTPRIGAMVEVPSAVVMISEIVEAADFVCLGTNDLVQYLLAVDRDNESVAGWFRTLHPSVLRSIKSVIDATTSAGKPLVLCGEMAGSPFYVPLLIGLGATELSMNVSAILRVRKVISGLAFAETAELAIEALKCRTADEIEATLEKHIGDKWSHLIQPDRMKRPRI
ncbi:MAG TPA: phosphoenolpyruvate--protein phosphotransferase [Pyrinomonadaceae bacterium]|nr:phosphoenolpyruvate--protein phosphotransferase [Pyrinomonadaceae bacterium]